ncbi:PH domain-containing protein [Sphingobacterium bovistauri]|uniref:Uncharacterized protein n=1 Tax=Sphingobacterium bovistauri TaxID=2781959 RepID=A0ABS7Z1L1_9SPHI|nr:hypothetical protein [Sphingobacterium bovistauri]MCA5004065.1 hypothetical protein [Sphingobacterium bovistauri]
MISCFSHLLNKIHIEFCKSDQIITEHRLNSINEVLGDFEKDLASFRFEIIELLTNEPNKAVGKLNYSIIISNQIFASLLLTVKIRRSNSNERIKYLKILNLIEEILDYREHVRCDVIDELPVTNYRLSTIKFVYNEKLKILRLNLVEYNINNELIDLVLNELRNVITKKVILQSELVYAIELISILMKEPLTNERIYQILIEYDFNCTVFLQYCLNKSNELLVQDCSLHQQLNGIFTLEENLNIIVQLQNGKRLLKNKSSIADELKKYYKQNKELIIQRIDNKRAELLDSKLWEESEKITLNTSVSQLALLIRLFIDIGFLPKDNFRKTFGFFTKHFRTASTVFMSRDSLQKKSSDVEFATALKVKSILLDMVNIVNKNHNASHYRDS